MVVELRRGNAGLSAAPASRVRLVDQLDVGAVTLLQCASVLLASARLKRRAALTIVTGLKGVAVGLQEQSLANNAHGFCLIGSFKNQYALSGSALGADLGLAGQYGTGHVVGVVGAAEGGNGHGLKQVVEALATGEPIIRTKAPVSRR